MGEDLLRTVFIVGIACIIIGVLGLALASVALVVGVSR